MAMQTVRAASAPSSLANRLRPESKRIRSAVTNGERTFVLGDGNSPWARRRQDLLALHIQDLGGEEMMSENQLSLCRRASTLEVELEMAEGRFGSSPANGVAILRRSCLWR